jgi:hypothetical protein
VAQKDRSEASTGAIACSWNAHFPEEGKFLFLIVRILPFFLLSFFPFFLLLLFCLCSLLTQFIGADVAAMLIPDFDIRGGSHP